MNLSTLRVTNLGRLAGELPKSPPPGIEFVATCLDSAHNIIYIAEQAPTETKGTLFSDGTTSIGWMPQRCEVCGHVLMIDLFEQTAKVAEAAVNWRPIVEDDIVENEIIEEDVVEVKDVINDNVTELRPEKSSSPPGDIAVAQ